ncbi:hypothetical protein GY45DRAFT_1315975 [Cubamyces sp. BRFM 1775]|nr:hypothetical protein GY45DRAFT_1315975 [Cubamyces sp. BRFM 1775]
MSFPITPSSSSPARPRRSDPQPQHDGPSSQRQKPTGTIFKFDEYVMQTIPDWVPHTEEEFKAQMKNSGVTEAETQALIDQCNWAAEDGFKSGALRVRALGRKPAVDDPNVYTVRIPGTDLAIRMWDGGMDLYGQFCLDFFDVRRKVAVNLPKGYALWPAGTNAPGVFMMPMDGPLPSWEACYGYKPEAIPAGEEKWSVVAGSYITLQRSNRPEDNFTFAVPMRQVPTYQCRPIAQPVRGPVLQGFAQGLQ